MTLKKTIFVPLLFLCLLVLIGIVFIRSTTPSKELRAMSESSVSTKQLTTGREVRRFIHKKGVTLGKPMPAEVLIVYEPKDEYTQKDVFDEVLGFLEKERWEKKELSAPNPEYYVASLPQNGFLIIAEVSTSSDSNDVVLTLKTTPF